MSSGVCRYSGKWSVKYLSLNWDFEKEASHGGQVVIDRRGEDAVHGTVTVETDSGTVESKLAGEARSEGRFFAGLLFPLDSWPRQLIGLTGYELTHGKREVWGRERGDEIRCRVVLNLLGSLGGRPDEGSLHLLFRGSLAAHDGPEEANRP